MKKRWMEFLSFIGKLRYNYNAYIYFYSLPIDVSDDSSKGDLIREQLLKSVQNDLGSKIEYIDFFTDYTSAKTFFILGSHKENLFYIPLFYEIFAYIKKSDIKFSYKYETKEIRSTKILKFKVKCYGKK